MEYIILDTEEIVSQGELRRRNPDTSFPAVWGKDVLEFLGVSVVFQQPIPEHNPESQYAYAGPIVLTNKGHYERTWIVADLDQQTIDKNRAEKLEQLKSSIISQVQARLNDFAKTRGYDDILSACTYATSTITKFQTEGQYCVTVRDNTWNMLYTILADIENGIRSIPTGYSDIESELPQLEWPQ